MQYLCELYPNKLGKLYGNGDLNTKTIINVMLSWYQSYFRQVLFGRIKIIVYGTIKKGIPHTLAQLKEVDKLMDEALNHLEQILKGTPYIAGNNLSIADLLIYF
jgi:glutathione S-transferase